MKKSIVFFSLILFIASCQSNSFSRPDYAKSAGDLKQELRQREIEQIPSYLMVNATARSNFLGEKVIEGTIASSSSVTVFKDVVLEITFISKTVTPISVTRQIVYDIISPNTKIPFKIKTFAPQGTASFSVRVIGATPI